MYAVHLVYNKPLDKHFFGVYKDLEVLADSVSPYISVSVTDAQAHLIATDVYINEENSCRIEVGEINSNMVDFACGKKFRIPSRDLLPH